MLRQLEAAALQLLQHLRLHQLNPAAKHPSTDPDEARTAAAAAAAAAKAAAAAAAKAAKGGE